MHRHKKTRKSNAQAVDDLARNVANQTAKLKQKAEKLHDGVKRVEEIHQEVEKTLQQARQTLKERERRRRAG